MSGPRLVIGIVVFGIVLPLILCFLLHLHTLSELLTIAAATFLAWGAADLLAIILEKPRLPNRSPGDAIKSSRPSSPEADRSS